MTVFDTRQSSQGIPLAVVLMVVVLLVVLFITWEITSEVDFSGTFTTSIPPEQVADSATSPVTTAGS